MLSVNVFREYSLRCFSAAYMVYYSTSVGKKLEVCFIIDEDGEEFTIRVREEMAVAFQHELDHLNGILFTDKIDPKNPYKNKDRMREI